MIPVVITTCGMDAEGWNFYGDCNFHKACDYYDEWPKPVIILHKCNTINDITNFVNKKIYKILVDLIDDDILLINSQYTSEKNIKITIYNVILNFIINKIDMKVDYFLNDKWNEFDTDNCYKNFGVLFDNKSIKLSFD